MPRLGQWLVPLVAWLFAVSTIISWSYYGEQGVVYLLGERAVKPYRALYTLACLVACTPLIATEAELDVVSTLGTGLMLFANIPIMLAFGPRAMRAYYEYVGRLKRGEMRSVSTSAVPIPVPADDPKKRSRSP
ncbi:MAG: alanine:cation symporter family protein [Sandaracinaceae bacterium]|nr:alanine:cation symporter family protein [Sandaracinaceae bacterium]